MINSQKRGQQKSCNCRNSKCMKLYCQCFSARVPCGKSCHCIDCQNTSIRDLFRQSYVSDKRLTREQLIRAHKGCACRRSGCTKKYCQCFQSGILCKESCKCIDCQNNQSLTNRKVINQLRRNNSEISNPDNSISLYPLYLSQNSQHLQSIITSSNPLSLQENWLQNCAKFLYESAKSGSASVVMDKLIQILSELEQNITQQQQIALHQQQFSQQIDQQINGQSKKDMRKKRQSSGEYNQGNASKQLDQQEEQFRQNSEMEEESYQQNNFKMRGRQQNEMKQQQQQTPKNQNQAQLQQPAVTEIEKTPQKAVKQEIEQQN